MTTKTTAITLSMLRTWVPIIFSMGALVFAYTNQQQENMIRLSILEITVQENLEPRVSQLEEEVDTLRALILKSHQ